MPKSEAYTFFTQEADDGVYYVFITDNTVVYTVYFRTDEYIEYLDKFPVLLQNSYGFGFFINSGKCSDIDRGVLSTIEKIVVDFLSSQDDDVILLYHCQTDSNVEDPLKRLRISRSKTTPQAKRERIFQSKYEQSEHRNEYMKKSLHYRLI